MAGRILSGLFWATAALLVAFSVRAGGWALLVPGALVVAFVVFAFDLYRHWDAVTIDLALVRTMAHVLSTVVLATGCMVWLARLLLTGRFGF